MSSWWEGSQRSWPQQTWGTWGAATWGDASCSTWSGATGFRWACKEADADESFERRRPTTDAEDQEDGFGWSEHAGQSSWAANVSKLGQALGSSMTWRPPSRVLASSSAMPTDAAGSHAGVNGNKYAAEPGQAMQDAGSPVALGEVASPQRSFPQQSSAVEQTSEHWTSAMKWQDDFTGEGKDPLKGKHFNDMIIEKCSGGEIIEIVDTYMNEFSVVNAVTALHRIAKAEDGQSWRRDPRIKYLNRRITKMFASAKRDDIEKKETGRRVPGAEWVYYIDTRSLCNAAWAFAHLSLRHDEMMEAISEETCKKIYDCNAQQLAICAWSYAKMMRADLQLMQALAEEIVHRMQEFSPQHIMNTVWACAKLKFLHIELLMCLADAARCMLEDFTPQHLSITAWGFATLGFRHIPLMDAIAAEVAKTIRAFKPQNIANTAWAFTTLDLPNEWLLGILADAAMQKLHEYSPQNLTNIVWAFTASRLTHDRLFNAAAEEVAQRVGEFDSQGLAMMASTFASVGTLHCPMFEAIAQAAVASIACFTARDLESIVCAYAGLALKSPDLFAAVAQQSPSKLREFNSLDLANLAWAFAKVRVWPAPLMDSVARKALNLISEGSFPSQALASIAWAYYECEASDHFILAAVSREVERKLQRQDLQHLVALLGLGLQCNEAVARRLGAILYHVSLALPQDPWGWHSDMYGQLILGLKAEHLGNSTGFALAMLHVPEASAEFQVQALVELRKFYSQNAQKKDATASTACGRGAAFVDYSLSLGAEPHGVLRGTLFHEDALPSPGCPKKFRPVRWLKVGPLVDRSYCAILKALEDVSDLALGRFGPACGTDARGRVQLFSLGYPCLSCLGVLCQFRQAYPGVNLEACYDRNQETSHYGSV